MVEERVEEEGEYKVNGRSPPPPRKRPLSASASPPSLPLKKKARDLLDLSNCHSCGLHFPSKIRTGHLQTLDSQWRIVLLCEECLARIRSAAACSYCFSAITNGDEIETFLDCRQCSCRVHISCIPHQRGYVLLPDLDPDSFTCVDCSALPRYRSRNPSCFGNPLSNSVSRVSLEDLARDASSAAEKKANLAAKAKEKALKKAEVAMRAAEVARNALDAVIVAKEPLRSPDLVVADEELALQLHRAMNGSHRISRSSRTTCLDRSDLKKVRGSCKNVEFCIEDKAFFESMDWNSSIRKEQKKESDGESESSPVLIRVKEEHESCSEKVVNSTGDDNCVGSVLISCKKIIESTGILAVGENFSQQKNRCDSPDRYVKKYSKRKSSSKGTMNRNESQLVPCWQMSCSKTCTLADAPYQFTAVPMHPSPYSSLSGCQS